MKKILSLVASSMMTFSIVVQANFNEGVVAYLTGDYDRAFVTMQSLAELSEHAYAQYYLGMMYYKGQGVSQDYEEAGKWYRKAAEQSVPQAQYKLGDLYYNGLGLPKDYEFAFIWFSVGSAHGHKASLAGIEKVTPELSNSEITDLESTISEYTQKYGPKEGVDPSQPIEIDKG